MSEVINRAACCYYCGGLIGETKIIVNRKGIGLIFCSQTHADLSRAEAYR